MKRFDINQFSRREWLGSRLAAWPHTGAPQPNFSGVYCRDYSKCLPDYLAALTRQLFRSTFYVDIA